MIRRKISLYRTKTLVSLRDFGIKHTLLRILEEILLGRFFLYRQYIIYEKQLADLDYPGLRNPNLKFSFISAGESELLQQIEDLSGLPQELISEKLTDGGECIVASDNNKLAGFNLVSIGNVHVRYIHGYLALTESEAWSEQITVSPSYQRSGLATDLRHIMFRRLSQQGYAKLIGGYVPFNVRSGLLAKKLGFVERQKITLVKILGRKKYFVQSLAPVPSEPLPLRARP